MTSQRFALIAAWLIAANSWAAPLSPDQNSIVARARRQEKHGWIYLHIEGSPHDRGFQHGYLLAPEIKDALHSQQFLWEYGSAMPWSWLLEKSAGFTAPKIDPELVAEFDGMVEGLAAAGVKTTRNELITFNAWFELDWYWWPKFKKDLGAEASLPVKQSCSSFIATGSATKDGGVVLGHNSMIDYPEAYFNVVLDLQPEHGHRILMQTAPGWVHSGTDFFVTDAGLVGSETTIGGFDGFDEKGIPEFARMRRATQDASTIDQWCEIMKRGNNGGYANAWLLGDINTREIARLELGLKQIGFERKKDGFFVGSNVAENRKLVVFETSGGDNDVRLSSVARRVQWKKLMHQYDGKIDLRLAKKFEADHYDSFLELQKPGSRSLCGHFELESQFWGDWPGGPFFPAGTIDGKVLDSSMARKMSFAARWGSACGTPFDASKFLAAHPQFDWSREILKSRPTEPWTEFTAGE